MYGELTQVSICKHFTSVLSSKISSILDYSHIKYRLTATKLISCSVKQKTAAFDGHSSTAGSRNED